MSSKIAFLSPSGRSLSMRPPLAYLSLSAFLEESGIGSDIVESKGFSAKKSLEKSFEKLHRLKPEIIGLTCLTTEVLEARAVAQRLHKEFPEATLIVGGVHPTLRPQDLIFENSGIDYAIMGEGEETSLELVQKILANDVSGKTMGKVQGIAFLNEKKIEITEKRPLIKDLAALPSPNYGKIDMDFYTRPDIYCIRGVPISGFYFFTSRGCPFACQFCVNKNLFGRTIRYKDPVKVVEDIEAVVKKNGIDGFYFYDDTFTVNRKHVERICSELKERKLDLIWGCETRVNLVYKDLMAAMKKAGCVQIDFGVESGSEINLKRLQKGITVPEIKNCFKICKEVGIRTFANFMLNTPDETEQDVEETIQLARELNANVSIFNVTTPFPGTEIYDKLGGVPLEDYETLGPNPSSFNVWLSMIETKYKLSEHKMPLGTLLERLNKEFPSIHSLSFGNPKHLARFLNNMAFLFKPSYIAKLLRSKHRKQYLEFLLHVSDYLKAQKNVEESENQ